MFFLYFIQCSYLVVNFVSALPSEIRQTGQQDDLVKRAPRRRVLLAFYIEPKTQLTLSNGKSTFPDHSSLFVSGFGDDGPRKLDLEVDKVDPDDPTTWKYGIAVNDYGNDEASKVFMLEDKLQDDGIMRKVLYQGRTDKKNKEFFDPDSKKGIFVDATYTGSSWTYVEPNSQTYMDFYAKWTVTAEVGAKVHIPAVYLVDASGNAVEGNSVTIDDPDCKRKAKRAGVCPAPFSGDGKPEKGAGGDVDMSKITGTNELSTDTKVQTTVFGTDSNPRSSILKVNGELKSITTIGKDAFVALGVVGDLVGAAFVILDFVDHNWVGGAIGLAGLVAGAAVVAAVSGPVGWVVGGVVAAFFAILPLAFQDAKPPANRTNIQQIIQWKMFGDKDHTGNEKCQEDHDGVKGNKDCQALYGAGTLTMALGFNNFDSIAFLTHFNDGYAMSIKDMATAFYVIDETKSGDGNDKIATITCHNKKGTPAGRAGVIGGDRENVCDDPEFKLNRALITLPNLNESADKVFDRIIPAPGGDCKLIAYPRDNFFPDFGFTLTGLPSAIACGLNAGIDVGNGKIVPVEGDDNGKPLTPGSEPSQSTDGQDGACVKPPNKATNHFKPLAQTDYLCLIHANDQPFCLPPGPYHRQSSLGFEIKDVDSLTLPGFPGPSDWGLKTHWRWENQDHQRQTRYDGNEYKVNQDPTKKSPEWSKFEKDMKQMDMNESGESTFTVEGPGDGPDPVCCLFSDTSFGGNVWCVGVGGGDALPQWKDVAQSVSCHAGAQVTLYAKEYGDCGGAVIKGNVEDLKNEPFGNQKETFSKNVKALWVANGA